MATVQFDDGAKSDVVDAHVALITRATRSLVWTSDPADLVRYKVDSSLIRRPLAWCKRIVVARRRWINALDGADPAIKTRRLEPNCRRGAPPLDREGHLAIDG